MQPFEVEPHDSEHIVKDDSLDPRLESEWEGFSKTLLQKPIHSFELLQVKVQSRSGSFDAIGTKFSQILLHLSTVRIQV